MQASRIEALVRQLQGALGGNRVLRGTITSAGAVSVGAGFSVNKTGTGAYTVSFDAAYTAVPSVVVSVEGGGAITAKTGARAVGSFTVGTFRTTDGVSLDLAFNFVAVG